MINRKSVKNMQTVQEQRPESGAADNRAFITPAPPAGFEFWKRIFDVTLSLLALVLLSPIFLVAAVAIRLEDGGPAFYTQTRLTKGGKPFKMYKFRSMCVGAEQMLDSLMDRNEMTGPAFKIKNDPRITKVGNILRKTSVDELPQLLNIIKGDMSIVGPRPPLPREVAQYTPYQLHRLDVKTGLACFHECQGRSSSHDFDEWVEADLRYIRQRSIRTDLKIIYWTLRIVITGKGAM